MNDSIIINQILADVKRRFNDHSPDPAWKEYVLDTDKDYHLYEILDQGRVDFDEPFSCMDIGEELTLYDIILLYCYYYMQMHYESNLLVYKENVEFILGNLASRQKLIFLDFGCGPLTSGLAMAEFFRQTNASCELYYIGIDLSEGMLAFAEHLHSKFGLGPNCSSPAQFVLVKDFQEIPALLQELVRGDKADFSVFINFSYFLSAYSLRVERLIEVIVAIANQNSELPICVTYQNPRRRSLNLRWQHFKQAVTHVLQPLEGHAGSQVKQFTFLDLTGGLAT